MIVTTLRVANLRAIEEAEFIFEPGFNLIVGINGVGKTSALHALGVCLSAALRTVNTLRFRAEAFSPDDIRIGANALEAECGIQIGEGKHDYLVHKPREDSVPQKAKAGMPREQVYATPTASGFIGAVPLPVPNKSPGGRPFALAFSTKRAVPSTRAPRKGAAMGGVAGAFTDAFANRDLGLGEFAAWMKVQESMRPERPHARLILDACERSVVRFLPEYKHLRLGGEGKPLLLIDHGATTIPVAMLSDGERGLLALVLDLTRRLAQANPELADPPAEAEAVVLIDEIELHLHPKWQRQIVRNLTSAFPQCQFIATTHSPQIIGEVEHDHIQIISEGMVYSPSHSFGVDSSRVLEEIMNANPRTARVNTLLSDAYQAMEEERVDEVTILVESLVTLLGEGDPEVTRLRTFLDFMEYG